MMLTDLHMHSSYSDGKNAPEEMIEAAVRIGYEAIALTDHVWKTSDWVPAYAAHLEALKKKYEADIIVYSGVEAKVVSLEGDIDADPSFDACVDLVLGSFHRIPKRDGYFSRADADRIPKSQIAENWLEAFYGMLANPRVDIIAHPLSELRPFGLKEDELPLREIAERIAQSGKILEFNVRYNSLGQPIIKQAAERGVPFTVSSDSHSAAALIASASLVRTASQSGLRLADIRDTLRKK